MSCTKGYSMTQIVVDNLKYKIHKSNKTATCLGFDKPSDQKTLIIPNNIRHNIKVTSIGNSAFECCSGLTSVTLPESVTSPGDDAFYVCHNLTSVTLPNSLTSIGISAFWGCSGLTSVTLPESVTTIGNLAFYGCLCLTSITLPDSVTTIGNNAFAECSKLTSVMFSETSSLTSIGDYAFSGCKYLSEVICNAKKEPLIGTEAFYGVSKNCILKIKKREGYNPELWGMRVEYVGNCN